MSRVVLTSLMPTVILSSLTDYQNFLVSSPASVTFSVAGPKGDAGRGIVWRGDYNEETAYAVLDVVLYNGGSYLCEVACTGVVPTTEANWSIVAAAAGNWEILDLGSFI